MDIFLGSCPKSSISWGLAYKYVSELSVDVSDGSIKKPHRPSTFPLSIFGHFYLFNRLIWSALSRCHLWSPPQQIYCKAPQWPWTVWLPYTSGNQKPSASTISKASRWKRNWGADLNTERGAAGFSQKATFQVRLYSIITVNSTNE